MTLKELYSSIFTRLTATPSPALKVYYSEQLPLDAEGNLIPPSDPAYLVISLSTDTAVTDFDNETYSSVSVQLAAWATDAEAALDILHTALSTLAPDWERETTGSLGLDTGYVGYVASVGKVR